MSITELEQKNEPIHRKVNLKTQGCLLLLAMIEQVTPALSSFIGLIVPPKMLKF